MKNLWPQPVKPPGAHEKDTLQNWLRKQVCSGSVSLQDAQTSIADHWFAVWERMSRGPQK
jgi:hypothetical protein